MKKTLKPSYIWQISRIEHPILKTQNPYNNMAEKAKKRGKLSIIISGIFILLIIIFALNYANKINLTGLITYDSQPDETSGIDTYLRTSQASAYGSSPTLSIGKTGGDLELRGLIKFDVSSIPTGNTILNSIMQLHVSSSSNANTITIKAYRLTSSWSEENATWLNKTNTELWATAGGDYGEEIVSVNVSNVEWYNFSIANAIRGWVNGTYANYGIILISTTANSGDYKDIDSSDSGDSSLRPRLTVEHIENAAPTITSVTTNSNLTNRKQVGQSITFNISWQDLDSSQANAFVCNTSAITLAGCTDKTFCSTSLASTNPMQCSYTALTSDNKTTNFWVKVCDSENCSEVNQSAFYVNHFPIINITQPNGGETVNQSQGNYSIKFNITDADDDYLTANLYYSSSRGGTEELIASNLNLSTYCTDIDSKTSTQNNCTYSWNSTRVYGPYYLTSIVNDSASVSNDSSDSSFNSVSLEDNSAPRIISQWPETSTTPSFSKMQIYANVTDANIQRVWVFVNTTPETNLTMNSANNLTYNATFTAPEIGTYQYKVYAIDRVGNLNNSMPYSTIEVSKPTFNSQTRFSPSTSLPYAVIKIEGRINTTSPLRDVYAFLNVPPEFTFLNGYSQNLNIGNFTSNETRNATWFLSAPLAEANYTLNITYTDYYNNVWNDSSIYVSVTSSIGGDYSLTIAGYPEVETTGKYFIESYFKKANAYFTPDNMKVSLYDPLGNLIVGPVSMTATSSTGIYNYSYTTAASSTEGQWRTIINATKSSVSYYAYSFWKLIGGPFDVRNITIEDAETPNLQVKVTTENTGGAVKDLTLIWNLTRTDTNEPLTSGAETFAVNPYSTKDWTVYPITSYVGSVKISFLGRYSGTESAGAYKLFTTTSASTTPTTGGTTGGGGGGGAIITKRADLNVQGIDKVVYFTKNLAKTIRITIKNNGTKDITNLSLNIKNLDSQYYAISPITSSSLKQGQTTTFDVKFIFTDFTGEKDIVYSINSNEINKEISSILNITNIKDYFLNEISRLKNRLIELNASKANEKDLKNCEDIINKLVPEIEKENYLEADNIIKEADDCLNQIKISLEEGKLPTISLPKIEIQWAWIITWLLIAILITVLAIIAWIIYRKITLTSFIKNEIRTAEPLKSKTTEREMFNQKLESIQKKIGMKKED